MAADMPVMHRYEPCPWCHSILHNIPSFWSCIPRQSGLSSSSFQAQYPKWRQGISTFSWGWVAATFRKGTWRVGWLFSNAFAGISGAVRRTPVFMKGISSLSGPWTVFLLQSTHNPVSFPWATAVPFRERGCHGTTVILWPPTCGKIETTLSR